MCLLYTGSTWSQIQGSWSNTPFSTKDCLCYHRTRKLLNTFCSRFFYWCSNPVVFETGISVWNLYPLLGDHHGSLDLLEWDKHHNIPWSQPQKWGYESTKKNNERSQRFVVQKSKDFVSFKVNWPQVQIFIMCDGIKKKSLPFVESCWPLFSQHSPGTVDSTLVLARWWVHVPGFHYIHWGSDHCGNKAGTKRRHKVARQIVCGES